MNIELKELNDKNIDEYLSLGVNENQNSFIETPLGSLNDRDTLAWNINWRILAIYGDDIMVGYLMYGRNKYNDIWLDRFMIDKRYQHKGYGKKALELILKLIKNEFKVYRRLLLSVTIGNDNAISFYEKFGFRLTGEIEDDELVMELKD